MPKIIGYIVAVIGLAVVALSKQIAAWLTFLGAKAALYTLMAGIVLIILGIAFVLMKGSPFSSSSSNVKHASEEVPIYEGEGKGKRIVGYHRSKK